MMRIVDAYDAVPPFQVSEPSEPKVPFVFNTPHSGTHYTRALLAQSQLDRRAIRSSEDTFVDEIFAPVTTLGAPLMRANFPRVFVDLNRDANELDPSMFNGPLSEPTNAESPRVVGGLGVIARVVGDRQEIYANTLPAAEATERLERYYHPYHQKLGALLEETADRFGTAVLVDCHSMPSGAVKASTEGGPGRADIVLGDRYGTSCVPHLTEALARLLRRQGFAVGLNRPYAGGFITERYGKPPLVHAIQIEINRALYMDEAGYYRNANFAALQDELMSVFGALTQSFAGALHADAWPMAAE